MGNLTTSIPSCSLSRPYRQFLLVPCFGLTVTPRKAVPNPYHIFDTDVVSNQLSGFGFGLESRVGIHAPCTHAATVP